MFIELTKYYTPHKAKCHVNAKRILVVEQESDHTRIHLNDQTTIAVAETPRTILDMINTKEQSNRKQRQC